MDDVQWIEQHEVSQITQQKVDQVDIKGSNQRAAVLYEDYQEGTIWNDAGNCDNEREYRWIIPMRCFRTEYRQIPVKSAVSLSRIISRQI